MIGSFQIDQPRDLFRMPRSHRTQLLSRQGMSREHRPTELKSVDHRENVVTQPVGGVVLSRRVIPYTWHHAVSFVPLQPKRERSALRPQKVRFGACPGSRDGCAIRAALPFGNRANRLGGNSEIEPSSLAESEAITSVVWSMLCSSAFHPPPSAS